MQARLHSLTPGFHGFHVHQTGICDRGAADGPFTTAGGHYTNGDSTHGEHAGDMPSLLVTQDGRAQLDFTTDRFSLADLRDADGSAIMVHAGRDNFANIPDRYSTAGQAGPDAVTLATGDSGSRAACGVIEPRQLNSVKAVVRDTEGRRVGTVSIRRVGTEVRVQARLHSLTPGFHGFHVHQTGICDRGAADGPFTTAGGHYTNGDSTHGEHAGDMPSLLVTQDGRAQLDFTTDRFSLADLRDTDGSAIMVHAGRDNFANIPDRYSTAGQAGPDAVTLATGDSGSRAACGVVD